jgi:hypothetical protein
MDENIFSLLNFILLGIAGVVVLLYLIFLTRKRLTSGYKHPKDKTDHSPPQKNTFTDDKN